MNENLRKHRLEQIAKHADKLTELSKAYDRLRWMAEEDASDAFLDLTEAAGQMTVDNLRQLGSLLEILWQSGITKSEEKRQ